MAGKRCGGIEKMVNLSERAKWNKVPPLFLLWHIRIT